VPAGLRGAGRAVRAAGSRAAGGSGVRVLLVESDESPAQSIPGEPCALGEECTGGSVCVQGACACYDGLVQVGEVCVAPPLPPVTAVAVGLPCGQAAPCVAGALCRANVCSCGPAYAPLGGACVRAVRKLKL